MSGLLGYNESSLQGNCPFFMPLYEYLCHRCGKNFEVLQKFADKALTLHPECGGEVERLVSVSALKFKGSGWYVNDYGSGKASAPDSKNGHANKTGGESKSEAKSEVKSETKSETKSEGKSEAKPESKPAPAASVEK